ncbi:MAG TPA: ATP-binding protein [Egibacteraceae bacterium]|nr:ATP-binding protein [Egibacteraceae bacterium]
MALDARLRKVSLFAGLSDDDLVRICEGVEDLDLAPGEVLFTEGEEGDTAYVIVSGEIEVLKATGRRQTLLALRGPGDVIGEMALLQSEPRIATIRARSPAQLLTIPKSVLDRLFETSPSALHSVFSTLLERLRENSDRLRQTERMAQLGTLTAGIAHELNNPAAGASRAAERLDDALARLTAEMPAAAQLDPETLRAVAERAEQLRRTSLDALARSDEEAAVESWLDSRGVPDGWRIASDLVDAGVSTTALDEISDHLDSDRVAATVLLLAALAAPRELAREIAEGVRRVSEIVGRLKSHAFLDRAPVQDVDVRQGLDDTLMLLAHKLRGIRVIRQYEEGLPLIMAAGAELNQVWTNLIDNAAYELERSAVPDPTIVVRARTDADEVVIEVEDNGPGIPADLRERIFDAFFTTKPPGSGTGQGLNISYQIIVLDHHGELTVESQPGRTTFRVVLPLKAAAAATIAAEEPGDGG